MSQQKTAEKTFLDILKTKSFSKLKPYTDPSMWQTLSLSEKKLLAKLFILRGEKELSSSRRKSAVAKAKTSFTLATDLLPLDHMLWYKRGQALSKSAEKSLVEEASLCYEKAVQLNPDFVDGWCAWATLMMQSAITFDDPSFLMRAEDMLKNAHALIESEPKNDRTHAQFYWHYGFLSFMCARHSEEAVDFNKAVMLYRKAKEAGCDSPEFYNDFGNALVEFSLLINQPQMLFEAIEYYLLSVDDANTSRTNPQELASRCFNLGSCYQCLFEIHHEEEFFKQALHYFTESTKHNPEFFRSYIHWANLLLYAAKLWQNVICLKDAIGVFSQAAQISPQEPVLLAQLSEALCLLGNQEDNLKMLHDANALATCALEIDPDLTDARASLALSLYYLGRYFDDERYFVDALQKIDTKEVLEKNISGIFHLIALIKAAFAECVEDPVLLQEALVAYEEAAKGEQARFGYFYNDFALTLLHLAELTQDIHLAERAVDLFERAVVSHDFSHPYWLVNLGSAFVFLADLTDDEAAYEKAIQVLMSALEIDPESSACRFHLGIAYSHLSEMQNDQEILDKAIHFFNEALNDDTEDEHAHSEIGLAYIHKAHFLSDEDRKHALERAEYHFLQAKNLGSIGVLYNIACLYSLLQNEALSIQYLEKAYEEGAVPLVESILEDDWLDFIKPTKAFQTIIHKLKAEAAAEDES